MPMSKDDFRAQYKALYPDASDEIIDKVYDEATKFTDKAINYLKGDAKGDTTMPTDPKTPTLDDLKLVDWQSIAEVILTSTFQRYINYWILKKTASKVLGRKLTFKEVYFASMALRALVRTATEVGVSRVHVEREAVEKVKKALEPITKK